MSGPTIIPSSAAGMSYHRKRRSAAATGSFPTPGKGGKVRRRLVVLTAVLAMMLVTVVSAHAITFGEPDGNTHRNVGALIAEWDPESPGLELLCSGSLISSRVFLTAAHCTAFLESEGIEDVFVSFAQDNDPVDPATLHAGTMFTHPEFPGPASDPKDIAVVVLDAPVAGIKPAKLPTAGLFDQMKKAGTLKGQKFTAVGYGVHEPEIGGGPPTFPFDGERWRAVSEFNALNQSWLRLSQNDATNDGGTCFGDSGGPNFLGTGSQTVPGVVASITITGDAMCLATNDTYRMDTASARNFLGQFVKLP